MNNLYSINKKVVIITDQCFEDEEVIYPVIRLYEEGVVVDIATKDKKLVLGRFGFPIDYLINNHANLVDARKLNADNYDAVIFPGGFEAPDRVRQIPEVLDFVLDMNKKNKLIVAFCHGPWILISAGIIKGKNATCYKGMKDDLINSGAVYLDEPVVEDGNIITSRHPKDIGLLMKAVLKHI